MGGKVQLVQPRLSDTIDEAIEASMLTQAIHAIEKQAEKEPYDLRIQLLAGAITLLLGMLPTLAAFFTAEGKTLAGCADYMDKTCGIGWNFDTKREDKRNDALFDYFGITGETLEGAV